MTEACQDAREPILDKIARMKASVARLEALHRHYPDLTIKQTAMADIYQSKAIWREVDKLEVLQGQSQLKVCPYRDLKVVFHANDKTYESEYKIYTDPMEIILIGFYFKKGDIGTIDDYHTILSIQDYMTRIGANPCPDKIIRQIELELYKYLKRTILSEPNSYKIEGDEYLPEKLQTLITFA